MAASQLTLLLAHFPGQIPAGCWGSRHLHAVIDNFSRRILGWQIADRFNPANTVAVLLEAGQVHHTESHPPMVVADGGVENVNHRVDLLIRSGLLRRVIALTELRFSNSMIESWWRALKHQWLYLNTLDSLERVRTLVEFYVKEHNSTLPHSAFKGQTPDEMYFGRGDEISIDRRPPHPTAVSGLTSVPR